MEHIFDAEVTQKKVARKPKDNTFSITRYWRSFGTGGRSCVVLGLVTIAILLLAIFALSVSRADRAMAKELQLEQQKAAAKQDKRRQVPPAAGVCAVPLRRTDTRQSALSWSPLHMIAGVVTVPACR